MIDKVHEQTIVGHGDELAKRSVAAGNYSTNNEERIIKLTGLSSFFDLTNVSSPDLSARIHALNHLLHAHENLTTSKFNHALMLLSLEHVLLQTASTPPQHSYANPSLSSLLFDHPFDLETVSKERSVVPISEVNSSTSLPSGPISYTLQLGKTHCSLEHYSVLEFLETNGLLQVLISLQFTHPYIEVFKHQHSESLILVVHTGFDGSPKHEHKLSSHTHTRVGFQNYLQYVAERYNHLIDEAVEEDERRKKGREEEGRAIIAQRMKEAEERQQEALAPLEEEQTVDAGKSKKKGDSITHKPSITKTNPALKKSVISTTSTPMSSNADLHVTETSLPPFEKDKRFIGYDMGDVVLLKESTHTTLFTGDGVQIQSRRHMVMDGAPPPSELSLLHNGHRVVCTQVWTPENDDISKQSNDKPGDESETNAASPSDPGIPQPPPHIQSASLHACFNNSLQVSCSHYGPKANGELLVLPHRPKVLDFTPQSDQLQVLSTQQGVSPKLSKKQQEHQQQMLEQQRALEAQMEKERQLAQLKYQKEYDILVRNNQHQQLYISTEFGLEVRCQVLVNSTDAADSEAFILVKQHYSFPDTATRLNEHVSKEKCRFYHPEGYVIKLMKDESVIILCADGTKYRPASTKEVEFLNIRRSVSRSLHQKQPIKDDHDVTDSGNRLSSANANKLKTAENAVCPPELKQNIWVVTTPAGNCYVFEEEEEPKKEVTAEESNADQENKENIDPSPIPSNVRGNNLIIPMGSVHILKATDPINKEVRCSVTVAKHFNILIMVSPCRCT